MMWCFSCFSGQQSCIFGRWVGVPKHAAMLRFEPQSPFCKPHSVGGVLDWTKTGVSDARRTPQREGKAPGLVVMYRLIMALPAKDGITRIRAGGGGVHGGGSTRTPYRRGPVQT